MVPINLAGMKELHVGLRSKVCAFKTSVSVFAIQGERTTAGRTDEHDSSHVWISKTDAALRHLCHHRDKGALYHGARGRARVDP